MVGSLLYTTDLTEGNALLSVETPKVKKLHMLMPAKQMLLRMFLAFSKTMQHDPARKNLDLKFDPTNILKSVNAVRLMKDINFTDLDLNDKEKKAFLNVALKLSKVTIMQFMNFSEQYKLALSEFKTGIVSFETSTAAPNQESVNIGRNSLDLQFDKKQSLNDYSVGAFSGFRPVSQPRLSKQHSLESNPLGNIYGLFNG